MKFVIKIWLRKNFFQCPRAKEIREVTARAYSEFNIFLDPAEIQSLNSMEGVPDCKPAAIEELPGERALKTAWQKAAHRGFNWFGAMSPGVVLAMALAVTGGYLAEWIGKSLLGFPRSPVSPVLLAVLLGLVIRNLVGLPKTFEQGLRLCLRRILRIGVALLGLKLSISAVGVIGLRALPVVIGCVGVAILLVSWLSRIIKLPSRLGSLIAVGTSICGVTAVIAAGTATNADEDEISYGVAVITLFGTIALFTYPFLAHWLFDGNAEQIGLFLGTAIHDTSQVAGAGLMYQLYYDSPATLEVAATTKLVRNVFMGLVIPVLAVTCQRRNAAQKAAKLPMPWLKWSQSVPLFLVGFVALAVVRSIGDFGEKPLGFLEVETWDAFLSFNSSVSIFLLTTAIAAVGLGTNMTKLKVLGWKPLLIGFSAAFLVGGASYALVSLLY